MRRLLLFRHATAERGALGTSDQARELTPEGRADATAMGRYIARHAFRPDRVLVSPAVRTRESWTAMQPPALGNIATDLDAAIYDASPEGMLAVVKNAPVAAQTVMLIGHNPGLHQFAVQLTATGDIDVRERLRENFPTSGLAIFDFALESWAALHPRSGRLERFVSPKTISAATN
jgi:phosphohistidine phosphatase